MHKESEFLFKIFKNKKNQLTNNWSRICASAVSKSSSDIPSLFKSETLSEIKKKRKNKRVSLLQQDLPGYCLEIAKVQFPHR
jgi:hypothetical protein